MTRVDINYRFAEWIIGERRYECVRKGRNLPPVVKIQPRQINPRHGPRGGWQRHLSGASRLSASDFSLGAGEALPLENY
jgi:hypothetical protein